MMRITRSWTGEVYRLSGSGMEHGVRGMRLAGPLTMYIYQHSLGEVLHPDTRYVLDEGEDGIRRMRGPDLSFIRRERMPLPPYPPGFVRLVPDLIVEVRSPHDTFSEFAAAHQRPSGSRYPAGLAGGHAEAGR